MHMQNMLACAPEGFAHAAEVLTGCNMSDLLGSGRRHSFVIHQYRAGFSGTGHTSEMRNAMIASMMIYLLLLSLLVPWLGNPCIISESQFFMVLRAITLGFYYPRIPGDLELRRE